jgi:hypothetical protein
MMFRIPPKPAAGTAVAGQAGGSPLRLAVVGMADRQARSLEMALQGPGRGTCTLSDESQAQAFIVDMDSYQAHTTLSTLRRRFPDRPRLLLSLAHLDAETVEDDLLVSKPIRVNELIAQVQVLRERALSPPTRAANREPAPWGRAAAIDTHAREHAAQMLESQPASALIGTAHDVDPNDQVQLAKAYYDPHRFLQGLVCDARDEARVRGRGVRIAGPWPEIVLDPARGLARVTEPDARLRPYCVQPAAREQSRLEFLDDTPIDRELPGTLNLDALIWKLALWASRGRLPSDTPVDAPVTLVRWPNFTRLLVSPGAMRIAALWTHEPHSLLATAERLGLPQRAVFAFYSAASALELAHCHASPVRMRHTPSAPRVRGGIIGRIVRRLHAFT